ncbi:hypothetical protein AUJ14_04265 [Candidatus Micrarchaeota archaeon CG1_02_55_22]|nr:MAG: hypothetical protein AUJ14_04265 [Candidatus Micrarchaeota archaeon CG1_02_55_22]
MASGFEELVLTLFGSVLAASIVSFFILHYYSQKARKHFDRAEERINHAGTLLRDADSSIKKIRGGAKSKSSMRHVEQQISLAIADMLSAKKEQRVALRTV